MFVAVDLTPLDDSIKPSSIILHPHLAPYDLDEFSLPLSFSVDGQALVHLKDDLPVIYSHHRACDALHNGVPVTKKPRSLRSGDTVTVLSSDAPASTFVAYAVQVAYYSFSTDLRKESALDIQRLQTGATLAQQTDTNPQFPLMLPAEGKLPSPAPVGTHWNGIRELINHVRQTSARAALLRQESQQQQLRSSSPLCGPDPSIWTESRTYADIIAQATSLPTSSKSTRSPRIEAALPLPSSPSQTSPSTSVLPPSLPGSVSKSTLPPASFSDSTLTHPAAASVTSLASSPSSHSAPHTAVGFLSASVSALPQVLSARAIPTSKSLLPSSKPHAARHFSSGVEAQAIAAPLHDRLVHSANVALQRIQAAWLDLRRGVLAAEGSAGIGGVNGAHHLQERDSTTGLPVHPTASEPRTHSASRSSESCVPRVSVSASPALNHSASDSDKSRTFLTWTPASSRRGTPDHAPSAQLHLNNLPHWSDLGSTSFSACRPVAGRPALPPLPTYGSPLPMSSASTTAANGSLIPLLGHLACSLATFCERLPSVVLPFPHYGSFPIPFTPRLTH